MPKTMRESKMLQEVRRWRAEAYEEARRRPAAARLQHTREWARRLNLPMLDNDDEAGEDLDPSAAPAEQRRNRKM